MKHSVNNIRLIRKKFLTGNKSSFQKELVRRRVNEGNNTRKVSFRGIKEIRNAGNNRLQAKIIRRRIKSVPYLKKERTRGIKEIAKRAANIAKPTGKRIAKLPEKVGYS